MAYFFWTMGVYEAEERVIHRSFFLLVQVRALISILLRLLAVCVRVFGSGNVWPKKSPAGRYNGYYEQNSPSCKGSLCVSYHSSLWWIISPKKKKEKLTNLPPTTPCTSLYFSFKPPYKSIIMTVAKSYERAPHLGGKYVREISCLVCDCSSGRKLQMWTRGIPLKLISRKIPIMSVCVEA